MLVENQKVIVSWSNKVKKHYMSQGFEFTFDGDLFKVEPHNLTNGSSMIILFLCDYCLESGIEKVLPCKYYQYLQKNELSIVKKDCCKKCTPKKVAESNLINYGVRNTFELESIKEKSKTTIFEKYGVDNFTKTDEYIIKTKITNNKKRGVDFPTQSKEVRDKIKNNNIVKYGVENVMNLQETKDKIRETNLEKYGVAHITHLDSHWQKLKEKSLEKWGTEFPFQSKEIKDKTEQTNLLKYGVRHFLQPSEMRSGWVDNSQSISAKKKRKETNLVKYGFENVFQSEDIKDRIREGYLKEFGVEYNMQIPEVRAKVAESFFKNSTSPASSQQIAIFNTIKLMNYNVELNFPFNGLNLDIALFYEDIKIDIEYDGWYWHKNRLRQDYARDYFTKKQGWKVLRIKGNSMMPSNEEIDYAIKKLLSTDKTYTQIVLQDWGA